MIPGSSVLVSSTATEMISTWPLVNSSGAGVSSVPIAVSIARSSDSFVLDWSTMTFKGSAVVTAQQALTQFNSTAVYRYAWNLASITNPTANDTYLVGFVLTGSTTAVNCTSMAGEIRTWDPLVAAHTAGLLGAAVPASYGAGTVGNAVGNLPAAVAALPAAVVGQAVSGAAAGSLGANVLTARQMLVNRKAIVGQNLVVYADDNVTILATYGLTDANGGPISPAAGEPAAIS